MAALKGRGFNVQPFKVGPDYIDPTYHTGVTGNISRNLDGWMLSDDVLLELFERKASQADIAVIEGVMGLYDGKGTGEEGSTAHVAKMMRSPVILVVDARSMSRSAGALVLGYKQFDKKTDLKGVILNNLSGKTHYRYLKDSIERTTGIPVLGFLPKDSAIALSGRHLGLVPVAGKKLDTDICRTVAGLIEANVDMDRVIKLCMSAPPLPLFKKTIFARPPAKKKITIAVARDDAFLFYYEDNLDILRHLGAEIVEFSPLRSRKLPENIDGVYIGGGFPELSAKELSVNLSLKADIAIKARTGMPVYAECGGLMYLMKRLTDFNGRSFPMVGIFPYSVVMGDKLQSMGYVDISAVKDTLLCRKGGRIRSHVFHWSFLSEKINASRYAFTLKKNRRFHSYDGLSVNNVLCGYAHLHFGANTGFARNYIRSCEEYANKRGMFSPFIKGGTRGIFL
jgi:cobyrinic acid a,c-diamide synthase